MIEMDVKIGSGDLYDYMLKHTYSGASGIIGTCVGALLIVAFAQTLKPLYLVFGLIILLYLPWTLFIKSKQQILRNPSFSKPLHYKLDEEGLTISQGEDAITYEWKQVYKVVSTGRSIILYTSPVNATIFPKAQLQDKIAGVIEVISGHVAPNRVKIRG